MTPEELNTLKSQIDGDYTSDTKTGFGLLNVNERLYLTYGEECKLHINSQFGVGQRSTLRFPSVRLRRGRYRKKKNKDHKISNKMEVSTSINKKILYKFDAKFRIKIADMLLKCIL